MSRWAKDPDAAADALIGRSLGALNLSGRILLANPSSGLPGMLSQRGVGWQRWDRRLNGGSAQPWPPPGPLELALVRRGGLDLGLAPDLLEQAGRSVQEWQGGVAVGRQVIHPLVEEHLGGLQPRPSGGRAPSPWDARA